MTKSIVTIGEAMVEFRRGAGSAWEQGFAGDTLNVAWALRAILPGDQVKVGFLTRIGSDAFSNRFCDFLETSGIETGSVQRDLDRTIGLYTIENDDAGEREFNYWRGQSAARHLAANPEYLAKTLAGADLVYFSGITLAILPPKDRHDFLTILHDIKSSGKQLAFDPNIRPRLWEDTGTMGQIIEAAASISDIVLPTFDDERLAFGDRDAVETADRYQALGAVEIVVKDGIKATRYITKDTQGAVDVPAIVTAVDTTGAGDSFNGAYIASRLTGLDVSVAIRCGQNVSRAVVAERGALISTATISMSHYALQS